LGLWTLEYYDAGEEDFVEFTGRVEEIIEELSGHEEVSFLIPNTAANRSFVASDQLIRIKFDGTQLYFGVLYDIEYSKKQLKCIVYNGIYELLKRRVISGEYIGYMASSVAEFIRQAAGLIYMIDCPADNVDMIFDQTLCFDAIVQLAAVLNKDYWVVGGEHLHIGDRGSAQSFDGNIANVSERGMARSKKRDKVHVRGVSYEGEEIMGYAGDGDDVAVFWYDVPTTEYTLYALAVKKLAEINIDDGSVVLTCPITSGYHLYPGDTITLSKPELNLDGSYKIVKTSKKRKNMDIEVIRQKRTTEDVLEELMKQNSGALSSGVKNAFPFDCWEALIAQFGFFPKRGIRWADIWKYLPNINKSLIPASDNTYDIGDILTPLRWKAIFGVYEFPMYFGPYSDTAAMVQFWTKNKAGSAIVDHQFNPTDDEHGILGSETKRWKEVHTKYLFVSSSGRLAQLNIGDYASDQVVITSARVLQNVLADAAIITSGQFELARMPRDDVGKFLRTYGAEYDPMYALLAVADIPSLPASKITTGKFSTARLPYGTLGWFLKGYGAEVDPHYQPLDAEDILSGRFEVARMPDGAAGYFLKSYGIGFNPAFQPLATGDILSGRFPFARLPEGTAGYVLEAEGAGFDPMYVNPNGRYSPAGHDHAAGNITSGVLAEARCPNVYSGQVTFNGGIVTNSVNCANWQLADAIFANDFRITEAEKLGYSKGLAFLNDKGKVLMTLDAEGNLSVTGKIKQLKGD